MRSPYMWNTAHLHFCTLPCTKSVLEKFSRSIVFFGSAFQNLHFATFRFLFLFSRSNFSFFVLNSGFKSSYCSIFLQLFQFATVDFSCFQNFLSLGFSSPRL